MDEEEEVTPCHFCGDESGECHCTTTCQHCPHIGHEHYADGRCRGTNFDVYPWVQEPCESHEYKPRRVK